MQELEFNEAKAKAWVIEVDGELAEVDKLLIEVAEECATQPYEDDTLMMALKTVGDALGDAWNQLGEIFKDVVSETNDIISEIGKHTKNALEGIGEFFSNLKF